MQLSAPEQPTPDQAESTKPASYGWLTAFLLGGLVVLGLSSLSGPKPDAAKAVTADPLEGGQDFDQALVQHGARLARIHCGLCHLVPEPELLAKLTWAADVLPGKVVLLGLAAQAAGTNPSPGGKAAGDPPISQDDWRAICAYYLSASPAKPIPQAAPLQIAQTSPGFAATFPHFARPSANSLVKIEPQTGALFIGNAIDRTLDVFLAERGIVRTYTLPGVPMALQLATNGLYAVTADGIAPTDDANGRIVFVPLPTPGTPQEQRDLVTGLRHPRGLQLIDFNHDGREDLLITEQGRDTGRLSWHENLGDGQYRSHVLAEHRGALATQLVDFGKDGLPDLILITGPGDEGIHLLRNRGNGAFDSSILLRRDPAWGNTAFEVADFNGDGHPDLLVANGDVRARTGSTWIPRGHHGLRIYLNDGKEQFTEAKFMPLNGVTQVIARDFDRDGDLDIAAIAHFPDYNREPPFESFVYFRNEGALNFSASSMAEALTGRWASMDAADGDGDGDLDILLGAYNTDLGEVPAAFAKLWADRPVPLLVLENLSANSPAAPPGTTAPLPPAVR